MGYKAITVFCGSQDGNDEIYCRHAFDLGALLAKHKLQLVYGGGGKGLMGAVANGALQNEGIVTGIIPEVLLKWESYHRHLSKLEVVQDMHARKKLLYEMADAMVILPGGYGTMDELFELLTWNQLSIHSKPVYFLNSGQFYNPLLLHLEQMARSGFLYENITDRIHVVQEPISLIEHWKSLNFLPDNDF